jgi:NAD(P)-dependent dehydrogenase (short-subunit alcohol dehydrogenase family)
MWFAGLENAFQTNFLGPARVVHALAPLIEARAATPAGRADKFARLILHASAIAYGVGGADPLTMYYWAYAASKRAVLAYYDSLAAHLQAAGSPITASGLSAMAFTSGLAAGTRPAFLQPVDADGNPTGDQRFSGIMWLFRDGLNRALDPAWVAGADLQLLTEADPPADVSSGGWAWKPADRGRFGGQQDTWDIISQMEGLQSAFPFEADKEESHL